jgi:hypothetical protein
MESGPEQLAERYLTALEAFLEAVRRAPAEQLDRRAGEGGWSVRDVAFHAADVDQLLGLRLRRILAEDYPNLTGMSTQAGVVLFRRRRMDIGLALDALQAGGALNTAVIEQMTAETMARKGRHSQGHDLTAADLAAYMAMHLEAHTRQVARVLTAVGA